MLGRCCQGFSYEELVCSSWDQTVPQILLLPAWALKRSLIYPTSSFTVMQLDRSMAYMEPILIISVLVQHADESPSTCQKKPTSSPVALQREIGMSGNPPASSPHPPGISIQWHQQAQNPQRWPLASLHVAHLLHLPTGRQSFKGSSHCFSGEADVYHGAECSALQASTPAPPPIHTKVNKLPNSIWVSCDTVFHNEQCC